MTRIMPDMLFRLFQRIFFGDGDVQDMTPYQRRESELSGPARQAACNRLKLVLMHDRTQLEPDKLDQLRDELVAVISKYIPIDQQAIELNLEKDPETNTVALVANIPVLQQGRPSMVPGAMESTNPSVESSMSAT